MAISKNTREILTIATTDPKVADELINAIDAAGGGGGISFQDVLADLLVVPGPDDLSVDTETDTQQINIGTTNAHQVNIGNSNADDGGLIVLGCQTLMIGPLNMDTQMIKTNPQLLPAGQTWLPYYLTFCDAALGNIAISLPDSAVLDCTGAAFVFKKVDASMHTVTISAVGTSAALDGSTTFVLTTRWETVTVSNMTGNIWRVTAYYKPA